MVKGKLVGLVPPPPFPLPADAAGGLKTLTFAVPALAMSALLTVACIWVALLTLVVNVLCAPPAPAPHKTCEACAATAFTTKLLPVTVRESPALPATAQLGEIADMVGTGFPAGLMRNATEFESPLVPAPECGLSVLTNAVPDLATSDAGTVAVALVPRTFPLLSVSNVVARACPFHCTTVLATSPLPVTVSVNCGLPAVTLAGESAVMVPPVGT
jgi:hypothetical protein